MSLNNVVCEQPEFILTVLLLLGVNVQSEPLSYLAQGFYSLEAWRYVLPSYRALIEWQCHEVIVVLV